MRCVIQALRNQRCNLLVASGLSLMAVATATGQQRSTNEEAAVRQAAKAYVAALGRGDAKALEAAWTEKGTFIDPFGESHPAREMIRQQFGANTGASGGNDIAIDYESTIRFVTPEVAIEHGMTKSDAGPSSATPVAFTAVWVKQGGQWLLDTLREAHAKNSPPTQPLQAMRWMIGDWVGTGQDFVASWNASWSENKKFIVRQFTIGRPGGEELKGTQYVGWDPAAKRIRSWTFDSDGSIVEGTWRNEEDAWIVQTAAIQPDGRRSTSVSFWVPEGADGCVLKTSHIELDDTVLEDFVLEFARVKPN